MPQRVLFEAALRFALAVAVIAWLAYTYAAPGIESLLPLFRMELKGLMPAFRIDYLDWRIERGETVVALTATLTEYRAVLGEVYSPGVSVNASTLAMHALVHPVMMLSLVFAWPGVALKHKPALLALTLPMIVLAEALDVPLMLWGAVDDFLYWQVDPARLAESIGSRTQHLLDGGGRYALSIALALLSIALFRKLITTPAVLMDKM